MRRIGALAFLVFAALPAFAAGSGDNGALPIDARRLVVMMGQSREIAQSLGVTVPPQEPQESASVHDDLVSAVHSYNLLAQAGCGAKRLYGSFCGAPYAPAWLKPGEFDDAHMRAMTDEATGRLVLLWQAFCTMAPAPANGDPVCPME